MFFTTSFVLCSSALVAPVPTAANLQQSTEPIQPMKITKEAGRLKIEPGSYSRIFQEVRDVPSGTLEVRLKVKSNGEVSDFEKIEGSNPLWFTFRSAWRKIKFLPTREGDTGPWEVAMVVSTSSSGGGGMLEARATGSSSSSSTTRIYIADVSSLPSTPK
ncbi:hypothetical protein [Geothrix fuzhouensis]|uniref:hypothetical protein n=1 Tax=Geothrix fuzhouensis TaxID=2966451 RepID=UPI0021474540|nr:hypothetical protein [Geothrix fuzhouensis]